MTLLQFCNGMTLQIVKNLIYQLNSLSILDFFMILLQFCDGMTLQIVKNLIYLLNSLSILDFVFDDFAAILQWNTRWIVKNLIYPLNSQFATILQWE